MIEIPIINVEEDQISRPERPIQLNHYPDVKPERAWELANLIRIAAKDYQCFNDWFNNVNEEQGVFKEFTLEEDRQLKGIVHKNKNTWIYVKKDINNSTINEYNLIANKDLENDKKSLKDNDLKIKFSDDKYYKYRVLKTYDYVSYYPVRLDVDLDRFGFILEREEEGKKIIFVVFRGTRELAEWLSNAQFKQVNFLANEDDTNGIGGCGNISLGFNKMYTGFRPGVLIEYDSINTISQKFDKFIRIAIKKIDNFKTQQQSIYQAVSEYFSSKQLDTSANVYVTGHSLGGALATIAAMHIAVQNQLSTPVNLYTFASPRVGDNTFADKFNKLVYQDNKIKAFRFANSEDIVTKVPFPVWFKAGIDLEQKPALELARDMFNKVTGGIFDKDYQHVGTPIYFTHQARRVNTQGTLEPIAYIGDNHNMTSTYCGALERNKK